MNIADKEFPFEITDNEISFPATFKDNADKKIKYLKEGVSQGFVKAKVTIHLCREEFRKLFEYITFDLDSSKKYFICGVGVQGIYKKYICDIISNPKVEISGGIFTVVFDLAIVQEAS